MVTLGFRVLFICTDIISVIKFASFNYVLNNAIVALEFLNRGFLSRWYKSDTRVKMNYVDIYGIGAFVAKVNFLKLLLLKRKSHGPFIEKKKLIGLQRE